MHGQADISGAFARPTIVDYLIVAELEQLSLTLHIHVGALRVGIIGVNGGRVVFAELPGAEGDTALSLLTRLPKARVMPEPWTPHVSNVQASWRALVDGDLEHEAPGRSQRLSQIRAELRELESEAAQTTDGREAEIAPAELEAAPAAAELLDWAGVEAYLRGDIDGARAIFAQRDALCPGDLICAANLERLRLRLLEDEIAATVSEVSR